MEVLAWVLIVALMIVGVIGSIVPLIPGAALIIAGAVVHQLVFGGDEMRGWWVVGILVVLGVLSYVVDLAAGAMGAKRFGASKWGVWGGFLGAMVGLFFGIPGLLLGPILGVLAGELVLARKELGPAASASWGTIIGSLLGVLGKFVLAMLMVAIFCLSLWRK